MAVGNMVFISLLVSLSCDTYVSLHKSAMSADTSSGCVSNAINTEPLAIIG